MNDGTLPDPGEGGGGQSSHAVHPVCQRDSRQRILHGLIGHLAFYSTYRANVRVGLLYYALSPDVFSRA